MNILEFQNSPELMGNSFQGESRAAFRSVLAGAFAIPMENDALALFKRLAGGREPPTRRVSELWIIAGRRSEKTRQAACIALFLATVCAEQDALSSKLAPGELGVVSIVAVDRKQAAIAKSYADALTEGSKVLNAMVSKRDSEGIVFNNRTAIEIQTNSYRAIRGRTLLAVIFDECAFFRSDESANPDLELYRAALPGLATTGGMMIGISSPYAKKGILYQKYKKHFGKDGDILVVRGASRIFNPLLPEKLVEEALHDDPAAARSEWLGEFRDDIEGFISREVIEDLARTSPLELPFDSRHKYTAFTDPAGGGHDEFTLAICHREDEAQVVDLARGLRGTPASIVAEYAEILKSYKITTVRGDKYAGSWPGDEFRKHGIRYIPADQSKSALYVEVLPMLNSGRVQLPPNDKLINQFASLERRTSRVGKDSIDHEQGGHDDLANAVAGAVVTGSKRGTDLTNLNPISILKNPEDVGVMQSHC